MTALALAADDSTMRWYVNRTGQTIGPLDEANIMHWAETGQITRGMSFQAETGGPWLPVEHSPFARFVVAPAIAARAPAKGLPVWLWFALALGPFVLIGLLRAVGEPKKPPRTVAPIPTPQPPALKDPKDWFQFSEIRELGKVRTRHAKPTSVDETGSRLKLEYFDVPGFTGTVVATKVSDEYAWKIYTEATGARLCAPANWAPNARLYRDEGDKPMSAKWFALDGGPLTGLIVMALINERGSCTLQFATPEYAEAERWPLPPTPRAL